MKEKKVISAKEAAAYIGVGYRTFLNMVKDGKIPYLCPYGKMRKYDVGDLDGFINKCRIDAK